MGAFIGVLWGSVAFGQTAGHLFDDPAFQNELRNIRALPFGYNAICQDGDLKMKSRNSATFVVRASRLCSSWRDRPTGPGTLHFTLCSTDPSNIEHQGQRRPAVAECVKLTEQWFMPAITM